MVLSACGCSTRGTTGSGSDSDTSLPSDRFSVSGTVLDLDLQPIEDVFVTVSTEYCIPGRTTEAGHFEVSEVSPGDKRLITYGETASNGLFASLVFAFEADDTMTLTEPVLTPKLSELHPLDPDSPEDQVIETEDGLTLTLGAGSLTLAPFAPAEVQVARVPVEQAPAFTPEGVTLLDLFVLHPILSTLDPPAPVSFPADSGLAPGERVIFHSLDYDLGQLVPVATGTVDAEGRPTTSDGEGLLELTWVGISLEPS